MTVIGETPISRVMNPYEIVRDAVLKTPGMSPGSFVILFLSLSLLFTLLLL